MTSALSAAPGVDACPLFPRTVIGEGRASLLADADRVGDPAAMLDPLAAALVHDVVRADEVGMLLDEPGEAPTVADLLVGDRAVGSRSPAPRHPSRASVANATTSAATWPFMSSAPRPQTKPVALETGERRHRPLGGVGSDDVGVAEQHQRRPVAACRGRRATSDARLRLAADAAPTARPPRRGTRRDARPPAVSFPGGFEVSMRMSSARRRLVSVRTSAAIIARTVHDGAE